MIKRLCTLIFALAALLAAQTGALAMEGVIPPGDIVFTEPVKAVIFSHKTHVDEKGLTCDKCHTAIFELKAYTAQKKGDFVMESLYQGRYCGACHNGKVAFASNTQCARCHVGNNGLKDLQAKGEITITKAQGPEPAMVFGAGDSAAEFRHEKHSSFGCGDCHTSIFAMKKGGNAVTMSAIYAGKFCGACHNGQKAFATYDCSKCHPKMGSVGKSGPKGVINLGSGDNVAEFKHSVHTAKFSCDDCHPKVFPMAKTKLGMTMDKINAGKFCGVCHNGKAAFDGNDCGKCHPKMR